MANIKIKLVERDGTARTSLTNISWAWFDGTDPSTFVAPTDKGSTGTTDTSGFFTQSLTSSTLNPGQSGTLVLLSSDNLDTSAFILEVY